jgi:hypothetical protein
MEPTPAASARGAFAALFVLCVTLIATFVLGPAAHLPALAGGQTQPDLAFLAPPSMTDIYLSSLGDAGRVLYTRAEWFDFANALMVIAAGSLIIRWLATLLPDDVRWPRLLMVLPLAAGLLDVVENLLLLRAVKAYPALSPSILPWITSLKLVLILFTLLAIASLAAIALRLRRLAPVEL